MNFTDKVLYFEDLLIEPTMRASFAKRNVQSHSDFINDEFMSTQGSAVPSKPDTVSTDRPAFVNAGRWVWLCPGCNTGHILALGQGHAICNYCYTPEWVNIVWPSKEDQLAVDTLLAELPGQRLHAPLRNWSWDWTVERLQAIIVDAKAKIKAGTFNYRSLSIGSERVWAAGELLTASNFNTYISEIEKDLAGRNGIVEYENGLKLNATSPTQRYVDFTPGNAPISPSNGMVYHDSAAGYTRTRMAGAWHDWITRDDLANKINSQTLRIDRIIDDVEVTIPSGNRAVLVPDSTEWVHYDLVRFKARESADNTQTNISGFLLRQFIESLLPEDVGSSVLDTDKKRGIQVDRYDSNGVHRLYLGRTAGNGLLLLRTSGYDRSPQFTTMGARWQVG